MSMVQGDKELIARLKAIRLTKAKAAIRKASRQTAKDTIQPAIKAAAPSLTGALKAGIKVRALPRSKVWTGSKVTFGEEGGSKVFYGRFVEFGAKGKFGKPHIKARFFATNAAKQVKQTALNSFSGNIGQELDKTI